MKSSLWDSSKAREGFEGLSVYKETLSVFWVFYFNPSDYNKKGLLVFFFFFQFMILYSIIDWQEDIKTK